ncbi:Transcription factor GATA-4 [Coemansia sp. RSA 1646]|nr:Transcription factor GATA-4 [Coemansia sp. RSA 1646]
MDGFADSSQLTLINDDGASKWVSTVSNSRADSPLIRYVDSQASSIFDISVTESLVHQANSQFQFLPHLQQNSVPTIHAPQQPLFPWHTPINTQPLIQPAILTTPMATGTQTPQDSNVMQYDLHSMGGSEWGQVTNVNESFAMPAYLNQQLQQLQTHQQLQAHHQFQNSRQFHQQQEDLQFHAPLPLIAPDNTPAAHINSAISNSTHRGGIGTKSCSNCGVTEASTWRRHPRTGSSVCNACGLYFQLHEKEREWTINARGQRVVKRQPRGSMAKRRRQAAAARRPQQARRRAVDQNPLDLVRQEVIQVTASTAAISLDRHPSNVSTYNAGPIPFQSQGQSQNQQQPQTNAQPVVTPVTFRHYNPLSFEPRN